MLCRNLKTKGFSTTDALQAANTRSVARVLLGAYKVSQRGTNLQGILCITKGSTVKAFDDVAELRQAMDSVIPMVWAIN
jgi:hypothetical protein